MSYSSIFWLPLCAALTALGLAATWVWGRRRGRRAMMLGAAWSLIPLAAYLTGSIEMFWKIGDAIGKFAASFVFSPVKWAGIAVAGLSAVLFLAAGGRQRRKAARARAAERAAGKAAAEGGGTSPGSLTAGGAGAVPTIPLPAARKPEPASKPATPAKTKGSRKGSPPPDDDMKDIEDILRKRGI